MAAAEKEKAKEAPKEAAPAAPKARFPMKTALILVAVLVIEGVAISAAFMLSGGPKPVEAHGAAEDEAAAQEKPVEVLVVADRFPNTRTGRSYIYDTEIFVVVKKKHEDAVKEKLVEVQAQVKQELRTIFSRAEHSHLMEPTLSTLTRQIRAALDERLGVNAEGKSLLEDVIITKCIQIRIDF